MIERSFISGDGVRLAYKDFGEKSARALVLCHGLAANGVQFAADAEFFAAEGFRVLVPDLRGHGQSGSPKSTTRENFAITRLAADLIAMLDHAGVAQVDWVGNSLGGIVALEMLKARRFRTLTTFGTAYALSLPRIGGHKLILLAHALLGKPMVARLTSWAVTRDPGARALIAAMLQAARPEVTAVLADVLTRYDLIAEAKAAKLPMLLIRCGRDAQVNAALGSTLSAMRGRENCELAEIATGGHCANLDATAEFRKIVTGFWQRT